MLRFLPQRSKRGRPLGLVVRHNVAAPPDRASHVGLHPFHSFHGRTRPPRNQPASIKTKDPGPRCQLGDKKGQQSANRKSYSVLPCRGQNPPQGNATHWLRADALSRNEHEAWGCHRAPAARIQALTRPALPQPRARFWSTSRQLPDTWYSVHATQQHSLEDASDAAIKIPNRPEKNRSNRSQVSKSTCNDAPRFESLRQDAESHQARAPEPNSARPSSAGDAAPPASLSWVSSNAQEIAVGPQPGSEGRGPAVAHFAAEATAAAAAADPADPAAPAAAVPEPEPAPPEAPSSPPDPAEKTCEHQPLAPTRTRQQRRTAHPERGPVQPRRHDCSNNHQTLRLEQAVPCRRRHVPREAAA